MLDLEEGATLSEMMMAFSAFQSETETPSEWQGRMIAGMCLDNKTLNNSK